MKKARRGRFFPENGEKLKIKSSAELHLENLTAGI